MKRRTHKSEVEAIRKLVHSLGGTCNVLHQSGRVRGSAGIPDLYIQMPSVAGGQREGQTFWVEVKVGRDKLSDAQVAFVERENAACRDVVMGGVEEMIEFLRWEGWRIGGV